LQVIDHKNPNNTKPVTRTKHAPSVYPQGPASSPVVFCAAC
jgi:hypothetical protein